MVSQAYQGAILTWTKEHIISLLIREYYTTPCYSNSHCAPSCTVPSKPASKPATCPASGATE